MTAVRPARSLYLDTNALIYANFYLCRPDGSPGLEYYIEGQRVVEALDRCKAARVRVFTTDLAYLEMYHNYYEWRRLKRAFEAHAPLGLLFGKGRQLDHAFLQAPLGEDEQRQVQDATHDWLAKWQYNTLVEFREPADIPMWFPIAKRVYSRYMETVIDCLHVAAAIGLECDYFLTQDEHLRKMIAELRQNRELSRELHSEARLSTDYRLPDPVRAQTFRPFAPRTSRRASAAKMAPPL